MCSFGVLAVAVVLVFGVFVAVRKQVVERLRCLEGSASLGSNGMVVALRIQRSSLHRKKKAAAPRTMSSLDAARVW